MKFALSIALLLSLLLTACGGGAYSGTKAPTEPGPNPVPSLTVSGEAVIKFRSLGDEWTALRERLRRIEDKTSPDRRLTLVNPQAQSQTTIEPPAGWSLIDFSLHPSGQVTVIFANDRELRLQRRAADGSLLLDSQFTDDQAAADPYLGDATQIWDSQSLVPQYTRDAVRLTPLGEDVLVVFRTGRNAVIAQRLAFSNTEPFTRRWRTLLEPGAFIVAVRLTSGTFDPFGSLDNQWRVAVDSDRRGLSAIAVSVGRTELPAAHRQYFGDALDPTLISGAIVTQLDSDGHRIGAVPVNTQVLSEVHAVRWLNDNIVVVGRMIPTVQPDGSGWDAYIAYFTATESSAHLRSLNFDRGDILFDAAPLSDGRVALVGSTGYLQNPTGGSISEDAQPLVAVMDSAFTSASRVSLMGGPRHNQLRSIAVWRDHTIMGGLQNGPGTHSADSDPSLLTCDGFVGELFLSR